jgi:hypothetical protein
MAPGHKLMLRRGDAKRLTGPLEIPAIFYNSAGLRRQTANASPEANETHSQ